VDYHYEPSKNPQAEAAFREGLRLREVGRDWRPFFVKAAELDPGFGAPRVRLAYQSAGSFVASGRQQFREAMLLRHSLSPLDRALLDDIEPIFQRQPADYAESLARTRRTMGAYPRSIDALAVLYTDLLTLGQDEEAIGWQKRAIEHYPGDGTLLRVLAWLQAGLGRFAEADATVDKCLQRQPAATSCLFVRVVLDSRRGECARVEASARRMLTIGPEYEAGRNLASALAAQGRPLTSVEEALRDRGPPVFTLPGRSGAYDRVLLAVLRGDFAAAAGEVGRLTPATELLREEVAHALLAGLEVEVQAESGNLDRARQVAEAFLARREGWQPDQLGNTWALSRDPTAPMVRALRAAGALTAAQARDLLDARRDYWSTRMPAGSRDHLWVDLYARAAGDREGGELAVHRLGKAPIPPFHPLEPLDARVGVALALAGQGDRAMPHLERASRACDVLIHPFEHVRAELMLGQVREQKGDRAGACSAYAGVIERWGRAIPASVTARTAQARATALGCR
jgi:serine/threonine-protein kinase